MPPTPTELQYWWQTRGQSALDELLNRQTLNSDSQECNFAREIQSRLISFDNDDERDQEIQETIPLFQQQLKISPIVNPQKTLMQISHHIFRDEVNNGIYHDRVAEGLQKLDQVERERVAAVQSAEHHIQALDQEKILLKELDNAAGLHYQQLYVGLRLHASV